MLSSSDRSPFDWLTVPEILADLDVPLEDWQEWESAGQAPSGVLFPDGQVRISHLAYKRWLDSLPSDDPGPLTNSEAVRNTIRYALKMAGTRGLSRAELCELFGHAITETAIDDGLTSLVLAGQCIPATAPPAAPPVTRYHYQEPR